MNKKEFENEMTGIKSKIMKMEKEFEGKVQEKPLTSIGIALGAGVIVGAFLTHMMKK